MNRASALYFCCLISFLLIILLTIQFNLAPSSENAEFQLSDNQRLLSLPKATNSMSDLLVILRAMESNIPFGFAHFNDGEISALDCLEGEKTVFSWNQRCTQKLNFAMRNAFLNTAPNFYVGIPCNCEFRGLFYLLALQNLNISHNLPYQLGEQNAHDHNSLPLNDREACPATSATLILPDDRLKDRITVATLFINGNFIRAKKELTRIIKKAIFVQGRGVHVVVAHDRFVDRLPFPLKSVQYVSKSDAFEINYEKFRTEKFLFDAQYEKDDIVLIMAGPVGRILASEWGQLRSDVTFLEMGSFWDTELWARPKHFLGISRACMDREDLIGLPCRNRWVHALPQIIPEGLLPLSYLC